MSIFQKCIDFSRKIQYLRKSIRFNFFTLNSLTTCRLCRNFNQPKCKNRMNWGIIGAGVGASLGAGYALKKDSKQKFILEGTVTEMNLLKNKPDIKPSRTIVSSVDTSGLQLTLFQYQTCPFCCKVRVLLDYYGLSYDVVEVDPVLRQEINWSNYRKVPILLVKIDREYQILIDSSMIISILVSYLYDKSIKISELVKYYPTIVIHDEKGKLKQEIINKYFIMYSNCLLKNKNVNEINEERKWRKWADDILVHTLSPNVYRTLDEAYQTFNWFSKVGHWEEYFPFWERVIIINIGAFAMWLISKFLKKKHNLNDDVRQSFYDVINFWLNEIKAKGSIFMGGLNPNLCDLTVYGILKSIEGCGAFEDALINTNLGIWYNAVKEKVDSHAGITFLKNP